MERYSRGDKLSRARAPHSTVISGDVMKESAVIALLLKAHAHAGLPETFSKNEYYIHVPEGAYQVAFGGSPWPLRRLLHQRKVRKYVAMTGEITLRGKVLPWWH